MQKLSDAELAAKTPAFKERIANGEKLISLLPEAFAVLRETSLRVMKMHHFDVQLMGAMALNEGKIAEMKTGEGKTLSATLAVYLNALTGKGVHVVTVNDYLATEEELGFLQLIRVALLHFDWNGPLGLPHLDATRVQLCRKATIRAWR